HAECGSSISHGVKRRARRRLAATTAWYEGTVRFMGRLLRIYGLACLALAFGYLFAHLGEPLRLNVGDPAGDARTIAATGVDRVWLLRLAAIALSAAALWFMFQFVRRVWSDTVAAIATPLYAATLLWLDYADSLSATPLAHATCFAA